MNGQLNSLESFDSGSNYRFGDKMIHSQRARSLFDLSHLKTTTIPKAGMMIPITWFETLPGDDHDINVDCLLRVLPQVVPLYSRQRLYIYGFYSRYSDLWNNWQVFMDKGYTGTDNRKIPTLHNSGTLSTSNITWQGTANTVSPNDLFDYMGLPIGMGLATSMLNNSPTTYAAISALPFMMFLRIYRDYFMNKNHWINDRVMLPDDDSRFRLQDDGTLMSARDQNKNFFFVKTGYTTSGGNTVGYDLMVDGDYYFSGCMHDYPDDYFTSALPFAQRGNVAPLTTTGTISGNLDFTNAMGSVSGTVTPNVFATGSNELVGLSSGGSQSSLVTSQLLGALNKGTFSGSAIALSITLENIRNLAINQQTMEQLARTDGSYFQFGLSFFGEPSKAAYDYRPTYIGGTYKNIAFTEVLQTATTQTTQSGQTVDNPAGAYVGHGITGISNGRIGHIHCDDYGMIMLLACIMPDVYYSQGLDKTFTEQVQEEKFLPDRALLGMQPILNKEIYYAGNNGTSVGDDNYLWAYQNPFDHLRYIPNKISGKIADPNNNTFYPYTQARHFTQLPNWGRDFSSTNDVRQDYLIAPTEDAYTAQFSMNIRSVRPLPYKAVPAKLVHA